MKKVISGVLFLFSFLLSAQELPFELDWSPIDTVRKTETVRGLMLANKRGVFALREHIVGFDRIKEYRIVHYDHFLQVIKKRKFNFSGNYGKKMIKYRLLFFVFFSSTKPICFITTYCCPNRNLRCWIVQQLR